MPTYTARQGQYLAFIHQYTVLNRRPPAEADIQQHFGVTPPTVHQMILTLERKKLIRRTPGVARTIQVLVPESGLPGLGNAESPDKGKPAKKGDRTGKTGKVEKVEKEPAVWPNIDWFIRGKGEITFGSVGPIRCAAIAADQHSALAMLVPGEANLSRTCSPASTRRSKRLWKTAPTRTRSMAETGAALADLSDAHATRRSYRVSCGDPRATQVSPPCIPRHRV